MANTSTNVVSLAEADSSPTNRYARWKGELKTAEEDLKPWHTRASKILDLYVDKKRSTDSLVDKRFNLFAANVDTLLAAMYANLPKIEVSRRFKDMDDDVGRVGSIILERTLQQNIEKTGTSFSCVVKQAIFDRLCPGAGMVWLRIEDLPDGRKQTAIEHVHYTDFLWSPCRTWEERRWVARKVYIDRDAGVKRFGDIFKQVPLDRKSQLESTQRSFEDEPHIVVQQATVYEIWDRKARKVLWISKNFPRILDEKDDYYGLTNFEPCPMPLFASLTTDKVEPIPDYVKAQDQYDSLDVIAQRLECLYLAVKVVGVYNKANTGIAEMLSEGTDNALIPVDNWGMFAEQGGIKGQVDWLPLDQVTAAISILSQAAEAKKQQIYELTGISDIVRGATKATETATAQQLKANFASARQQKIQQEVEAFVVEIMRIKAELELRHFPPEYFLETSNIMATQDAPYVQQALQLLQNTIAADYRITIQPESMAQIDYASEKANRMELLSTVSTYFEKAMPLSVSSPLAAQMIFTMLKFAVAGFKAGKDFEGVIDKFIQQSEQMQRQAAANPQPPPPTPQQLEMQLKQQEMQLKAQIEGQKLSMEQAKLQSGQQLANVELQKAQAELEIAKQELAIKQQELALTQQELTLKQEELALRQQEVSGKLEVELKKVESNLLQHTQTIESNERIASAKLETDIQLHSSNLEHQSNLKTMELGVKQQQSLLEAARKEQEKAEHEAKELSNEESSAQAREALQILAESNKKLAEHISKPVKRRLVEDDKGNPIGIEDID